LLQKRKHILLVGLDGDSSQKKFGELLEVIPLANHITKLNALCSICKDGTPAPYTKTKEKKEAQVDVGGAEKYISVCLAHLTNDK
jgi:thymidine kinase